MWNHNFDYVSDGNCIFSVVQQNSGSDCFQSEAAVMFFFFLQKTLSICIQSVLFISIFMGVSTVLFFHDHASSSKSNPCMHSANKNISRPK